MMSSLGKRLFGSPATRPAARRPKPAHRFQPALEQLGARDCPAGGGSGGITPDTFTWAATGYGSTSGDSPTPWEVDGLPALRAPTVGDTLIFPNTSGLKSCSMAGNDFHSITMNSISGQTITFTSELTMDTSSSLSGAGTLSVNGNIVFGNSIVSSGSSYIAGVVQTPGVGGANSILVLNSGTLEVGNSSDMQFSFYVGSAATMLFNSDVESLSGGSPSSFDTYTMSVYGTLNVTGMATWNTRAYTHTQIFINDGATMTISPQFLSAGLDVYHGAVIDWGTVTLDYNSELTLNSHWQTATVSGVGTVEGSLFVLAGGVFAMKGGNSHLNVAGNIYVDHSTFNATSSGTTLDDAYITNAPLEGGYASDFNLMRFSYSTLNIGGIEDESLMWEGHMTLTVSSNLRSIVQLDLGSYLVMNVNLDHDTNDILNCDMLAPAASATLYVRAIGDSEDTQYHVMIVVTPNSGSYDSYEFTNTDIDPSLVYDGFSGYAGTYTVSYP